MELKKKKVPTKTNPDLFLQSLKKKPQFGKKESKVAKSPHKTHPRTVWIQLLSKTDHRSKDAIHGIPMQSKCTDVSIKAKLSEMELKIRDPGRRLEEIKN